MQPQLRRNRRSILRNQQFSGPDARKLPRDYLNGIWRPELRCFEFSSCDVHECEPRLRPVKNATSKVVVPGVLEQTGLHHRAGGDNAHHFTRHQSVNRHRANLFANCNAVSAPNQNRQITLERMVGNARHGHGDALRNRSRRQYDIQLPRSQLRIRIECLIEITQTKQHKCVWILALDAQVLRPHRTSFVVTCFHNCNSKACNK